MLSSQKNFKFFIVSQDRLELSFYAYQANTLPLSYKPFLGDLATFFL